LPFLYFELLVKQPLFAPMDNTVLRVKLALLRVMRDIFYLRTSSMAHHSLCSLFGASDMFFTPQNICIAPSEGERTLTSFFSNIAT